MPLLSSKKLLLSIAFLFQPKKMVLVCSKTRNRGLGLVVATKGWLVKKRPPTCYAKLKQQTILNITYIILNIIKSNNNFLLQLLRENS